MSGEELSLADEAAARGVDGTQPSPRSIELDVNADLPPSRAEIEAMCNQGLAAARLTGSLTMPADAAGAQHFLSWVACLRDLTASAVPAEWQAEPDLAPLAAALRHISPPVTAAPAAFEEWRALHRYGICFWRSGPGFATITDRRSDGAAHQYILDTPDYLDAFIRAEKVVLRDELAAGSAEALEALEADNLVLSLYGWSLALPFRMRHWPVPFTAI